LVAKVDKQTTKIIAQYQKDPELLIAMSNILATITGNLAILQSQALVFSADAE
jgi:hypothetical protein